jgi:ribose 5-phosphate isomerase
MQNAKYLNSDKSMTSSSKNELSAIKEYEVVNTTIDGEDDIDNDLKPEN